MGDDTLEKKYRKLYTSVIFQALMDLTKLNTSVTDTSISITRDDARAWFFTTTGETAKDFEEICDNAGLNPLFVRSFASSVVNEKGNRNVKKRIVRFFD
tara:strand:+ start:46 stop:342 length:297 start_codon:yes stop_codon:yes gene_type:complete